MMERSDPHFDAVTARLLHREALRRAANELNTTSVPGLESVLARISAEVTAEAAGLLSLPSQRGRDGVIIQLKRVTPSNAHS